MTPSLPPQRARARSVKAFLMSVAASLVTCAALAGEPGRLEEDAEFLLGTWASDCSKGPARIFLSDGALRQEGLLQLAGSDGKVRTPITLLAATRDGVGLSLESRLRQDGVLASARYLARVINDEKIAVKSLTLCRDARCQTTQVDLPWVRCSAAD